MSTHPRQTASPSPWRLLLLLVAAALMAGGGLVGCDKDEAEESATEESGEPEGDDEDPITDDEAGATEAGDEMVIGEAGDFEMEDPAQAEAPSDDPVVPPTAAETAGGEASPTPGGQPATPGGDKPTRRVVEIERNVLKVGQMLDPKDVWKAFEYKGLLEAGDFVGQPPSKTYNAARLAGDDGGFGVALQVWKPGSASAATRHFDDLYKNSLGGSRTKDVGDLSFRTEHHGLRSVIFLDKRRSAVAWLTCGQEMCKFEELAELARRVQRKL